ncbi:class I SAM-dependent methyltransferase [Hoeflea sp.]|uniref:class I SAM-dependent methyltransferase n=1 Tax=Hoeflea sp. TaxID=1940281 RepID=UPI003A8F2D58
MLERIGKPEFASLSNPSVDALLVLSKLKIQKEELYIAEVGVGIGATTIEFCRMLNEKDKLYLFDYTSTLNELCIDLNENGYNNIYPFGSTKHTFDSYVWQLLKLAKHHINQGNPSIFDFIYLDGAHTFLHDSGAAAVCKLLLKPGGYLLFDDYNWTFMNSPTLNPEKSPAVLKWYSPEQLAYPNVKMVCEVLMDSDPNFSRQTLDGTISHSRVLYQKTDM